MNALPHTDVAHHASDHIIIPKSVYDSMSWTTGSIFIEVTNMLGQCVIGGLHKTHTENSSTIYMPVWMLNQLDSWYNLTVRQYYLNPCSELKLRICDTQLMNDAEFVDTLNKTLEKYNTVMLNSKILIPYKGYTCAYVDSFKPLGEATYLKKETTLSMVLMSQPAAPRSIAEEDPVIPFLALNPRKKPKPYAHAFMGTGHTLSTGNFAFTAMELRARAYEAAKRRKETGQQLMR
jgi:hypothetical protein